MTTKNQKIKKSAQEIQDEILRRMSAEERLKLALKLNGKILKIIKRKMKSRYPDIDPISLARKIQEHFSLERQFYDNIFNQFFQKELKKY